MISSDSADSSPQKNSSPQQFHNDVISSPQKFRNHSGSDSGSGSGSGSGSVGTTSADDDAECTLVIMTNGRNAAQDPH